MAGPYRHPAPPHEVAKKNLEKQLCFSRGGWKGTCRKGVVCTENLIRIDCVTESPNVNGDDRALLPLADPVRLAVQVEEPTSGRERGAPSSTDCAAAQGAGS